MHLKGRGDWMTVFLLEVPPGGKSAPQQHLFDEMFYVISGTGSVVVEMPDGGKHSFEWGPRSLFAPPLNARYQIFNASGREPVRLASRQRPAHPDEHLPQRGVLLRQSVSPSPSARACPASTAAKAR